VYGSDTCARCEEVKDAFKEKGILFSSEDIRYLNDPERNPNWRTNGSVELLAEVSFMDWNGDLPIVVVDDQVILAANADKIEVDGITVTLNKKKSSHCEGGLCKVSFAEPVMRDVAVA